MIPCVLLFPKNKLPVRPRCGSSGVVGLSYLVDVVSQSPPSGFAGMSALEFLAHLSIPTVSLATPLAPQGSACLETVLVNRHLDLWTSCLCHLGPLGCAFFDRSSPFWSFHHPVSTVTRGEVCLNDIDAFTFRWTYSLFFPFSLFPLSLSLFFL